MGYTMNELQKYTKHIQLKIFLRLFLIGSALMFLSCTTTKADNDKENILLNNPQNILTEISDRGARVIVAQIFQNEEEWDKLLQQVARGDDIWIRVAGELYRGSDGAAAEMLTLSLGDALEKNPEGVLSLTKDIISLNQVCTSPDIDQERYNSYILATEAISRRQQSLATVNNQVRVDLARQCSEMLEQARVSIKRFFQEE